MNLGGFGGELEISLVIPRCFDPIIGERINGGESECEHSQLSKKFAGKGKRSGTVPEGGSQVEGFVYYFSLVGRQTAMQKIDGAGERKIAVATIFLVAINAKMFNKILTN